jgi:hypothetical protein
MRIRRVHAAKEKGKKKKKTTKRVWLSVALTTGKRA